MRVVRTDLYFDERYAVYAHAPVMSPIAKAISTAWFQKEIAVEVGDLTEILFARTMIVTREEFAFKGFLAECIEEGLTGRLQRELRYHLDSNEIEEAYQMDVVIEHSPPMALPLSKLLAKSARRCYRHFHRLSDRY